MADLHVVFQVIGVLQECLPDCTVSDSLPEGKLLTESLPVVQVDLLAGEEKHTAFGGEGFPVVLDGIGLDVEVFATSRLQGMEVGERVRRVLHQLPHLAECPVTAVSVPDFSTREDLNPQVRVVGTVVDLDTRP